MTFTFTSIGGRHLCRQSARRRGPSPTATGSALFQPWKTTGWIRLPVMRLAYGMAAEMFSHLL